MNKIIDLDKYSHYINIKTINDQYLNVNPNDIYIGRELIYNGNWENHIVELLKSLCKENMTVIDIGANIGSHTVLISKLVGKKGTVYAFEPSKNHVEILFYNLMINNCTNTKIYCYGCGDKNENRFVNNEFLNTKVAANFGAIELKTESSSSNDEQVEIISIDSFDFSKIDVVKIDAEGMENLVINGMRNTIEKYKPIIIIEIHQPEFENMKNIFDSLNYSLCQIDPMRIWDYIAVPK